MTDARQLAQLLISEFDIHYRNFLTINRQSQERFESADWAGVQQAHKERISLYDQRVKDTIANIHREIAAEWLDEPHWHKVKDEFIKLLQSHWQPELAETFYNSVYCRLFDRFYFHNHNIFVESAAQTPAASFSEAVTREIPVKGNIRSALHRVLTDLPLSLPFENLDRDLDHLVRLFTENLKLSSTSKESMQVEAAIPLFYRNKAAYIVGRFSFNENCQAFIIPILNTEEGTVYADTLVTNPDELAVIFGFARSYFFVDTRSPMLLVQFLQQLMPQKSAAELYTCIGLQKAGKNYFYRDFLQHLKTTNDKFVVAPGIRGMVMAVFTLPSFPYVFKVIKDKFAPQKDMTRAGVKAKYQLVKEHDRVGRMADTWEYSHVAFPLDRFDVGLLEELRQTIASGLHINEDENRLMIDHCYIERRMIPLNIFLEDCTPEQETAVFNDYGQAIKELAAANIFPGDLLLKNFGITRHNRVIFYDYDEISYTTNVNFRKIPPPRFPDDELASEPWYSVGAMDVFPEEFVTFLFNNDRQKRLLTNLQGDLLNTDFWKKCQEKIQAGYFEDIFPYDVSRCIQRH